jgi:hypothetical protein
MWYDDNGEVHLFDIDDESSEDDYDYQPRKEEVKKVEDTAPKVTTTEEETKKSITSSKKSDKEKLDSIAKKKGKSLKKESK